MRTPQLRTSLLAAALVIGVAACNRAQTEQQTQRAADEAKAVAAEAGDRIADGWLTTKIQARYFADDQVKARYVDVSTRDGVVTVKGFVESPAARERALQLARETDGVKRVNDQLLIGQSPAAFESAQRPVATSGSEAAGAAAAGGVAKLDDARITSLIQAKYFLDSAVKGRRIDVDTRGGIVTLTGAVASERERAQALLLARMTEGVSRVEDHLSVNAALDPSAAGGAAGAGQTLSDVAKNAGGRVEDVALTAKVQAKFAADAQVKARAIEVTTKDGVVMLEGSVPSAAARQRAVTLARQTEGVVQVVDRLTVGRR
jgi:hyperosmotically inducible periplasmic protein